ncbi:MAG TPA: DUF1501 domain-containing protein [Pirellula sp.]|nr:DUF1501 domain-containing protein [Pirellula sp.]
MQSRRQFLKRSSLISLVPTIPTFLRATVDAAEVGQDKILVVVELSGGNDGLNTLVQYKDDGYLSNRTALRLDDNSLLKLNDTLALHPSMQGMAKLFEAGELAIVQGVGYPNPNRSHDVSMAVWHTARTDVELHRDMGWLGRGMDRLAVRQGVPSSVTAYSSAIPNAIRGRKSQTASIESLNEFARSNMMRPDLTTVLSDSKQSAVPLTNFLRQSALEAYTTSQRLRLLSESTSGKKESALSRLDSPIARQLGVIADLIQADFGSRVYYAVQSGYDTHSRQLNDHSALLRALSNSLTAFLKELSESGNGDRVLVMCFSEFGRQVKENASAGTDHGTAGPVFVAGKAVKGGVHGQSLDLQTLIDNAPRHTTDFRDVYAGILRDWLTIDPTKVLDGHSTALRLV